MLLKDLASAKQLDNAISDLHHKLAELYDKRSKIAKTTQSKQPPAPNLADLARAWSRFGVNLPKTTSFKRQFEKALRLISELEDADLTTVGSYTIIAVPPTKQLTSIIQSSNVKTGQRYANLNAELLKAVKPAKQWRILVISNQRQDVFGLDAFTRDKRYLLGGYDCRGLGLHELLAADLQGLSLVSEAEWTLLVTAEQAQPIIAAMVSNGQIRLELEDTGGYLGSNFFYRAIRIK